MPEVLSQDEIDNLLKGLKSEDASAKADEPAGSSGVELSSYDFRRPNRISKNQVRTIQTIHEAFATSFGYYLVSKLQTVSILNIVSVDQLFYTEYTSTVPNPSCLYVFDIEGTDGSALMQVSPELALCLVERMLGGPADRIRKPRAITLFEQSVMRNIIDQALKDLMNAWKFVSELSFVYNRLESEIDFVQLAPNSEIVVVIVVDVAIGANTYAMKLCFPTFALEDVITRLNKQSVSTAMSQVSAERERENIKVMQQQLSQQSVSVSVELGRADITVRDFISLKKGDVVRLDTGVNEEVMISIDNKKKLAGRPGGIEGKKAIRVTRQLEGEDLIDSETLMNLRP